MSESRKKVLENPRDIFRRANPGSLGRFLQRLSNLGVGLGVFSLVLVMGVVDGFEERIAQSISRITAPLMVLNQSSPEIPEVDVSGVQTAPARLTTGVLVWGDRVGLVEVNAVNAGEEPAVSGLSRPPHQGRWPTQTGEVALGTDLVTKLGNPEIGSSLLLVLGGEGRMVELVGVTDFGMYQLGSRVVISHLNELDAVSGVIGARKVFAQDLFETEVKIRSQISYPLIVRSWKDLNVGLLEAISMEKKLLFIILSFIVLMASMNLVSTLLVHGQERSYHYSVLRALGWSNWEMMKTVLKEGIGHSVSGVVVGMVLGCAAVFILSNVPIIPIPSDVYGFSSLPGKIQPGMLVVIFGVCMVLVSVAASIPAHLLTKRSIVKGLRG
jgi:ABC-type lipoprotein release transport system permease subunit